MRLSGTEDVATAGRGPSIPKSSFSEDWAAFALLAARLFNLDNEKLRDIAVPDYEISDSLMATEARFIRDLLIPNELPRIDGELVLARMGELLSALDASKSADDGRYRLALRLTSDSDLSRAVREASGLEIETDDPETQIAWIAADLGSTITVVASGLADNLQLFIRGRELVYRLKPFRGGSETATWQFAFCESAEPAGKWTKSINGKVELPASSIELLRQHIARQSLSRMRGRTPPWTKHIESLSGLAPTVDREARFHRAITLLHALEIALSAAKTFPVSVEKIDREAGTVTLNFRANQDGEELSVALGLDPPLTRFKEGLDLEDFGDGEGWAFTENPRLGQNQPSDIELTFDATIQEKDETQFRFKVSGQTPTLPHRGYLISASARGDFVQYRRRSKAIQLLKQHKELLQSLSDPRGRLMTSHDDVKENAGYLELDEAKRASLKELMAILPTYLLQGPPGVGKTFLIKDLVRRRFEGDQSSRILVTAQGNHAIDHLLDELSDLWAGADRQPLAVRCRPKDDKVEAGTFDLSVKTAKLVAKLKDTSLAKAASPSVKARLATLRIDAGGNAKAATERRSLEGLVMRSANMVFATTNSADLERLVEEKSQFDWAIVEEAGKATGCELITPLMLSHRRLLIGDHKQLPPFGARELEEILEKKDAVRSALTALPKLIDRSVRDLVDEDLLDFLNDDTKDIEALCADAVRALYLFEAALEDELKRQASRRGGKPIASTLNLQHRMHPTICELVSKSFYRGELKTAPKRMQEVVEQADWITTKNESLLPNLPVVMVNMPYERSLIGGGRIERTPRFTNEDEVAKIVEIIRLLGVSEACDKKQSIVVLAPYKRQVARLKDAVLGDGEAQEALRAFKPVARGGEWFSTVDAFQGNEADVVIFSLVRNNRFPTIRKALGFVGDRRRFNVLLSRAKQKLIFVGSMEFLSTISEPMGMAQDPNSDFLRVFLATVRTQIEDKKAGLVEVVLEKAQ